MENNLLDILVEPDGTEMLVLLVEDDRVDAERVERMLGSMVKLHVARTTSEAQRMARAFYYRCILLDLNLPDRSGLDVISVLKDYAPVVVLTGTGSESRAVEAMKRGADDYLSKDLLSSDIIQLTIAGAIKKRRLERAVSDQESRLAEHDRVRAASRLAALTHQECLGPLTELTLMLERIQLVDELPAEAGEYVDKGADAVRRLRELSRDVRALLESGAGDKRPARGPAWYRGLVVDDDEDNGTLLKRYLELSGSWKVDLVPSIPNALEAMGRNSYAAVLCHHEIQGHSAFELIAGAHRKGCAVPMAVYSNWRDERIATRTALAGAYAYFDLQVMSPETLLQCVELCVEEFQTRKELWQLKERRQAEAYLDAGSGLFNKRYLVEAMAACLQPLGPRPRTEGCLLLLELASGDSATVDAWNQRISHAGGQFREVLTDRALVVRYADTVLAVLLPACKGTEAPGVGANLTGLVGEGVSVAVGGAMFGEDAYPGVQLLLNEAERALAIARKSSGSRMEFATVKVDSNALTGAPGIDTSFDSTGQ